MIKPTITLPKVVFAIYNVCAFYMTIHICHAVLPKWFDIIVGLALSAFLLYKGAVYYMNRF